MRHKIMSAMVSLFVLIGGCSDKDRETVNKTGDGTESFKFDAKAVPAPSPAKPENNTVPGVGDGPKTFKFDPKAVPGVSAPGAKTTAS